tara:strand:+ start:146 stop:592 length:447 start_codon:yes stop_codon:yes gene_type:complete
MSYLAPDQGDQKRLQIAEIELSGQPAINGYFTFEALKDHNFDSAPTGISGTSLTLPAGHYMGRVALSITRTSSNQNYQFILEADGTEAGIRGQTSWYDNYRADFAEGDFSSSSAITLKVKALAIENSAPTLDTSTLGYSRLWLWRIAS